MAEEDVNVADVEKKTEDQAAASAVAPAVTADPVLPEPAPAPVCMFCKASGWGEQTGPMFHARGKSAHENCIKIAVMEAVK